MRLFVLEENYEQGQISELPIARQRNPTGWLEEKQLGGKREIKWKRRRENQKGKARGLFTQCTVEVEGRANERQVCKSLREIAEGFAMMPGFLSI